jgi:hypothetical protein
MNCNQAFELITDPVGAGSPALQQHLERCPRCRTMQQTLAPALDWMFSPADQPRDGHSSCGDSPFLSAQAVMVAEQVARSLPKHRGARWIDALRRAAVIGTVAALGVMFGAMLLEPKQHNPTVHPAGALTACLWDQRQLLVQLPDTSPRGVVVSCVMCHVPAAVQ